MKPKKSKKTKRSKKAAPKKTGESSTSSNSADIWFDGVDKKLIETQEKRTVAAKPAIKREASKGSLLTKTPLQPLSAYIEDNNKNTTEDRTSGKSDQNGLSNGSAGIELKRKDLIAPHKGLTDELAIDCEMVGCHNKSILARVSIVNLFGHVILDSYVAPQGKVTDYRTRWSGIRPEDIANAPSFKSVQQKVAKIVNGRIIVGHAVHNDFSVLNINHPPEKVRDTSHYFRNLFQGTTPSLRKLSEIVLGIIIQKGEHDSVQDAQATMKLYVVERDKWTEKFLKEGQQSSLLKELRAINPNRSIGQPKKKKTKTKPKSKKVKTFYVMTT